MESRWPTLKELIDQKNNRIYISGYTITYRNQGVYGGPPKDKIIVHLTDTYNSDRHFTIEANIHNHWSDEGSHYLETNPKDKDNFLEAIVYDIKISTKPEHTLHVENGDSDSIIALEITTNKGKLYLICSSIHSGYGYRLAELHFYNQIHKFEL